MHNFNKYLPINPDNTENMYLNSHLYWPQCADDAIVEKFINYGESLPASDAKIGDSSDTSKIVDSVRISKLSWMFYNDDSKELFDFMIDKIDRINYHNYGMLLNGMETMQYTKYPINGHYKFHNDITSLKTKTSRKLSVVLSLSDSNDYEGGEFLLMPHGENPIRFKFNKGDLIGFPSWIPHKVEPITAGTRITMVAWATGPKFV